MFHEGVKALDQVVICLIEIIGIPGIRDAAAASGKGQELVDLAVGIAACKTCHVGDVVRIHADQVIVMLVIGACHLACAVRDYGNSDGAELADGSVVRAVADLLAARCGRVDLKAVREPFFIDHILEHGLRHC